MELSTQQIRSAFRMWALIVPFWRAVCSAIGLPSAFTQHFLHWIVLSKPLLWILLSADVLYWSWMHQLKSLSLSAKWAWGVPQWQQQPRLHFTCYKAQCPEREQWQVAKQKPKNSPTFLTKTSTEGTEVSLLSALAFSTGFIRSALLAQGTATLCAHPCAHALTSVAKLPQPEVSKALLLAQSSRDSEKLLNQLIQLKLFN